MSELILHDRDRGIFKSILNKSKTIQGNYHVAPDYGHEINTANLNAYMNDEKYGASLQQYKKYPMCVCIIPRIVQKQESLGDPMIDYNHYHLAFLTQTNQDSNNNIKMRDRTGRSAHHIWFDWSDMKKCAEDFLYHLNKVLRKPEIASLLMARLDKVRVFKEVHNVGNDLVSGYIVSFTIERNINACTGNVDYENDVEFEIPDYTNNPIHELHAL